MQKRMRYLEVHIAGAPGARPRVTIDRPHDDGMTKRRRAFTPSSPRLRNIEDILNKALDNGEQMEIALLENSIWITAYDL